MKNFASTINLYITNLDGKNPAPITKRWLLFAAIVFSAGLIGAILLSIDVIVFLEPSLTVTILLIPLVIISVLMFTMCYALLIVIITGLLVKFWYHKDWKKWEDKAIANKLTKQMEE